MQKQTEKEDGAEEDKAAEAGKKGMFRDTALGAALGNGSHE